MEILVLCIHEDMIGIFSMKLIFSQLNGWGFFVWLLFLAFWPNLHEYQCLSNLAQVGLSHDTSVLRRLHSRITSYAHDREFNSLSAPSNKEYARLWMVRRDCSRGGWLTSVQFSHSVMSNSLQLHGLQRVRPPCPSPTPRVYSNSCPLSW